MERFAQYKAGYRASRRVRDFGVQLRPDLYGEQPALRTDAESEAYEQWLAAFFEAVGWPVN